MIQQQLLRFRRLPRAGLVDELPRGYVPFDFLLGVVLVRRPFEVIR